MSKTQLAGLPNQDLVKRKRAHEADLDDLDDLDKLDKLSKRRAAPPLGCEVSKKNSRLFVVCSS